MSLLRNLKHANIVTLHDLVHTERSLTLVFEYLVSGRGAGAERGGGPGLVPRGQGPRLRGGSEPGACPTPGLGPASGRASGQGSGQGGAEPGPVFQDRDLKQYLDHCGNLMSMHNVKVRACLSQTALQGLL